MKSIFPIITDIMLEDNKISSERKFLTRTINGDIAVINDKFAQMEHINTELTKQMIDEMKKLITNHRTSDLGLKYGTILYQISMGRINGAIDIEAYLKIFNKSTYGLNNRKSINMVLSLLNQENTYETKIINRIGKGEWTLGCVLPLYYEKISIGSNLMHCDDVFYDHRNKCWIVTEYITEEGTGRKFVALKRVWWK